MRGLTQGHILRGRAGSRQQREPCPPARPLNACLLPKPPPGHPSNGDIEEPSKNPDREAAIPVTWKRKQFGLRGHRGQWHRGKRGAGWQPWGRLGGRLGPRGYKHLRQLWGTQAGVGESQGHPALPCTGRPSWRHIASPRRGLLGCTMGVSVVAAAAGCNGGFNDLLAAWPYAPPQPGPGRPPSAVPPNPHQGAGDQRPPQIKRADTVEVLLDSMP